MNTIPTLVANLEKALCLERMVGAAKKKMSMYQDAVTVSPIGTAKSKARESLREAHAEHERLSSELSVLLGAFPDYNTIPASWFIQRVANARLEQTDLSALARAAEGTLEAALEAAKSSAWKRKAVRGVEPPEPKDVLDARARLQATKDAISLLAERIAPDVFVLEEEVRAQAVDAELAAWRNGGFTTATPAAVTEMLNREQAEFYAEATPLSRSWRRQRENAVATEEEEWSKTARRIQLLKTGS